MIIYKATNKINGKVYIGQSHKSLEERMRRHKNDSTRQDSYFYRAIRKYGWENFSWEIIDTAKTDEELNQKEIYWIQYYESFDNKEKGYNSTSGADHNYKLTQEECQKRSQRVSGEKNPMYGKPGTWLGKKFSEEHKKHLSESLKGRKTPWCTGKNHWLAKAVINLNTGEIFDTIQEAADAYHVSRDSISKQINGQTKNCNGFKWQFCKDIEDLENFQTIPINLDELITHKPVQCLETGKIYPTVKDVTQEFKCGHQTIKDCCLGKRESYKNRHFQYYFGDNTVLSYQGKIIPYRKCRDYQETSC